MLGLVLGSSWRKKPGTELYLMSSQLETSFQAMAPGASARTADNREDFILVEDAWAFSVATESWRPDKQEFRSSSEQAMRCAALYNSVELLSINTYRNCKCNHDRASCCTNEVIWSVPMLLWGLSAIGPSSRA